MKYIVNGGRLIVLTFIIIIFCLGFLLGDFYGASIPVLSQRLVPIYKVVRDDNYITITLDGTWGAEHTEELLKIARDNNVHFTFFFAGYWLEKYPDLVQKIALAGHEIGNHTYTHPHCNQLSKSELMTELEKTSDLIEELIGKRPVYFRPPFGEYNNQVIKTANEAGYQVIQWSVDSLDWQEPGARAIVNRVINNVSAGDIILMHNNAPETPEALRELIPRLKKEGYKIVPLSQLVYKKNYFIQSHNGYQVKEG